MPDASDSPRSTPLAALQGTPAPLPVLESTYSEILEAMRTGVAGTSEVADRVSSETDLRRVFTEVSTPNVSDAMHRAPEDRVRLW